MMKVAIIGATGYGGAELVRILRQHPHVSIHSVHASSLHGEPLATSFPHMQGLVDNRLESADLDKLAEEVDLVFTATPSGVRSEEHTSELQSRGHLVCRLLLEKKNK